MFELVDNAPQNAVIKVIGVGGGGGLAGIGLRIACQRQREEQRAEGQHGSARDLSGTPQRTPEGGLPVGYRQCLACQGRPSPPRPHLRLGTVMSGAGVRGQALFGERLSPSIAAQRGHPSAHRLASR